MNLDGQRLYRFDLSSNTTSSHPFKLSETSDGVHAGSDLPRVDYTVTVATGTNLAGSSGNVYVIAGVGSRPALSLQGARLYRFDLSDSTLGSHPLRFSTTSNGTHNSGSEYTTGVTVYGTQGSSGAYVEILTQNTNSTLHYYCTAHPNMGHAAQTISPTSGEAEYNPQIDEIIEEAYERTGVLGTRTGYQLRSARRSLNVMFQEWGNRGVHLWKVKLAKIPLVEGQAAVSYTHLTLPTNREV